MTKDEVDEQQAQTMREYLGSPSTELDTFIRRADAAGFRARSGEISFDDPAYLDFLGIGAVERLRGVRIRGIKWGEDFLARRALAYLGVSPIGQGG